MAGLRDGGARPRRHPRRAPRRRPLGTGRREHDRRPGHLGHAGAGRVGGRLVRDPERQGAGAAGGAGRRVGAGLQAPRRRRPPGHLAQPDGAGPSASASRPPRCSPSSCSPCPAAGRRPRCRGQPGRRARGRRGCEHPRPAGAGPHRGHPLGPPQAAAAARPGRRDRGPWCSTPRTATAPRPATPVAGGGEWPTRSVLMIDPGYGPAQPSGTRHRSGPHARARAGRRGAPGRRGCPRLGRARAADPADPGAQDRPDPAPAPPGVAAARARRARRPARQAVAPLAG